VHGPGPQRAHGRDRRGQDRAGPRAGPAARRAGAERHRPAGGGRGVRRGRLRAARRAARSARGAPAGGRGRGVDHRVDPRGDQVLGRDAVEVGVVEDRHVATSQALDEMLGPLPQPGDPPDFPRPGLRRCRARFRPGDSHRRSLRPIPDRRDSSGRLHDRVRAASG
jgi:hypothetical protein